MLTDLENVLDRDVKSWKLIENRFGGKTRNTDSRNQSKCL